MHPDKNIADKPLVTGVVQNIAAPCWTQLQGQPVSTVWETKLRDIGSVHTMLLQERAHHGLHSIVLTLQPARNDSFWRESGSFSSHGTGPTKPRGLGASVCVSGVFACFVKLIEEIA